MNEIIINEKKYLLSETANVFLKKYLLRMKNFIKNNKLEIEVYNDIEERVSEKFDELLEKQEVKEISDKSVISIVNEIWEPSEIFNDILEDNKNTWTDAKTAIKEIFSNKSKPLTRNSSKWIISWVCYWIGEKFDIDPLWIRLLFIIGTFAGGSTIILYIALIILLPDVSDKKSIETKTENK